MESRVHLDQYSELQALACDGCSSLHDILRKAVTSRTAELLTSFGPTN